MTDKKSEFKVINANVYYGSKCAVESFSATVTLGKALAVAGANGAGKTSLLGSIAGLVPGSGRVEIEGQALAPSIRARLQAGVRLVPEHGKIYPTMTVRENLIVGDKISGDVSIDDVYHWFPRLAERRHTLGGNLSGGEQQMLAIGMAILGTPKVLLLDEPTLGLSVPVIHDLAARLSDLRRALNLAVIVSESDVTWLSSLTDSVVVLDRGAVVASFDDFSTDTLRRIENHMVGLETA